MKKNFFLSVIAVFIGIATINAQDGGGHQRMTVSQRVDSAMSKIGVLNLDAATATKADSIFTDFYTAQQQMMQDMMSGGGQMDRDAMRQKRQQLADGRDAKLKAIFTDGQYNKWKNDIEPSLRPQRGNRQNAQ